MTPHLLLFEDRKQKQIKKQEKCTSHKLQLHKINRNCI